MTEADKQEVREHWEKLIEKIDLKDELMRLCEEIDYHCTFPKLEKRQDAVQDLCVVPYTELDGG